MTLTSSFKKTQSSHPTLSYKQLAEILGCDIDTLRGINNRLKLPIPTRMISPKGTKRRRDKEKENAAARLKRKLNADPYEVEKLKPTTVKFKPQVNRVYSKCGPTSTGYTRLL